MIESHFRGGKKGFAPDTICFSGSSSMVRKEKMLSTHSSLKHFACDDVVEVRSSENRTKCVIGGSRGLREAGGRWEGRRGCTSRWTGCVCVPAGPLC